MSEDRKPPPPRVYTAERRIADCERKLANAVDNVAWWGSRNAIQTKAWETQVRRQKKRLATLCAKGMTKEQQETPDA